MDKHRFLWHFLLSAYLCNWFAIEFNKLWQNDATFRGINQTHCCSSRKFASLIPYHTYVCMYLYIYIYIYIYISVPFESGWRGWSTDGRTRCFARHLLQLGSRISEFMIFYWCNNNHAQPQTTGEKLLQFDGSASRNNVMRHRSKLLQLQVASC